MLKILLLTLILIGAALILLAIRVIIKGKWPQTHVGRNKNLAKHGIKCASHTDTACKPVKGSTGCAGCTTLYNQ